MDQAANGSQFFLAHIFFFVVFIVLVWALGLVLRSHRDPTRLLMAGMPLVMIFLTAYLAPRLPWAHRLVNIVYDGWLIFNTIYFWRLGAPWLGYLYLAAVIGTALDFAMHFVIKIT